MSVDLARDRHVDRCAALGVESLWGQHDELRASRAKPGGSLGEALERGTSRNAWSPPTPTYSGGFQPGARSRTEPLAAASLSGSHAKGARACEVLAAVLSPKPSPSPPTVATSALHTHRCSMPEGGKWGGASE